MPFSNPSKVFTDRSQFFEVLGSSEARCPVERHPVLRILQEKDAESRIVVIGFGECHVDALDQFASRLTGLLRRDMQRKEVSRVPIPIRAEIPLASGLSLHAVLAIGLDVVVGVGMILANKKYLAERDELQQKIYLNALGITVGVALIAGVPYSVMDFSHVITCHAQIWHLLVLMSVTFIFSFLYGTLRYR
jgi:uncharacterized membrane protein